MAKKKRDAGTADDGKREERKQRSIEHRAEQDRRRRTKTLRSRAAVVVVVLSLVAVGYFVTRARSGDEFRDGEVRNGKQWSAAHGHWHDL